MSTRMQHKASSTRSCFTVTIIAVALALGLCAIGLAIWNGVGKTPAEDNRRAQATLAIAYSPEKGALFEELVRRFNDSRFKLPKGTVISLFAESQSPDQMVELAETDTYQAISPDSSIWLAEIDRRWAAERGSDAVLVGDRTRYMASPVVIAMWRDVATRLGYPERALGWADLLRAADADPTFKWSHASTSTASGLLATLAQFYAGAGLTRGLTEQAATSEQTLAYVTRLSRTVKHYGEGELAVMEQIEAHGRSFLDAFVVQEQLVIQYNQQHSDGLVAIYPAEGTLWEDHPLALLEHPDLTEDQRLAYSQFKAFLLTPEIQRLILSYGYRPADLTLSLDDPESPITAANGVDASQPYTTLQVPSPSVIDVVKNAWLYTKRHTNIYLVADVSGSMEGTKLQEAQAALKSFIEQVQGDDERVGLIVFETRPHEVVPLTQIGTGRADLEAAVDQLEASGNTALLDAVMLALRKLRALNDSERINAIVVMTDGMENSSTASLQALADALNQASGSDLPIIVFCIAYGNDADMEVLDTLSTAGGGFTRSGDPETIRDLYKTLSTYF